MGNRPPLKTPGEGTLRSPLGARGRTGSGGGLGGPPGDIGERAEGSDPSPRREPGQCPSSISRAGRGRAERSCCPRTDRQTDRLSIIPVPAALPSTTAKMLLLLLGIIVLHVTVLVLLFVSTIVSVSADCPCSGLPAGRGTARQEQRGLFLFLPAFPAWAVSGKPSLAGWRCQEQRDWGIGELVLSGTLGCVLWWVLRASTLVQGHKGCWKPSPHRPQAGSQPGAASEHPKSPLWG